MTAAGPSGGGDTIRTGMAMQIDFKTLTLPGKPNTWLVAPTGLTPASPHETAPEFPVPAEALRDAWMQVLADQPRLQVLARSADGLQVEAAQRTAVLRFTDLVSARIVPLDAGNSTMAIYSRSRVGYWDIGVNRRRVHRLMEALRKRLAGTPKG